MVASKRYLLFEFTLYVRDPTIEGSTFILFTKVFFTQWFRYLAVYAMINLNNIIRLFYLKE